ncbi:1429_t:CDS:2, partial [Gigaspora margarita]
MDEIDEKHQYGHKKRNNYEKKRNNTYLSDKVYHVQFFGLINKASRNYFNRNEDVIYKANKDEEVIDKNVRNSLACSNEKYQRNKEKVRDLPEPNKGENNIAETLNFLKYIYKTMTRLLQYLHNIINKS